jgi:acetolactate synthase I/II/III large subunit
VTDSREVAATVHEAFQRIVTGRPRPAEVEVPPDVLAGGGGSGPVATARPRQTGPDPDLVGRAAAMLREPS